MELYIYKQYYVGICFFVFTFTTNIIQVELCLHTPVDNYCRPNKLDIVDGFLTEYRCGRYVPFSIKIIIKITMNLWKVTHYGEMYIRGVRY